MPVGYSDGTFPSVRLPTRSMTYPGSSSGWTSQTEQTELFAQMEHIHIP
jgi:hypothetical protein